MVAQKTAARLAVLEAVTGPGSQGFMEAIVGVEPKSV
jgi:hypothetical protein